jgi:glycosyltransferase involved in cell wall biosynthesis
MLAALIMVKNEEKSIKTTLDSIKDHIKYVFVFDTGSTDKTLEIIKEKCKKNKQTLYVKQGTFQNFAVSRNDSIEFAESIAPAHGIEFLILLDAGDEFRCNKSTNNLLRTLKTIPPTHTMCVVKKEWLDKTGNIEHYDIRCIRANRNCRYDIRYPVHETFGKKTTQNIIFLDDLFVLYQNRLLHGESSNGRFVKDIEMLLAAPPTKRSYFYLGQTYMNSSDFENGYTYNKLAYETKETDESSNMDKMSDTTVLLRMFNCALNLKKDAETIFDLFDKVVSVDSNSIDAYIYLCKYCIDNDCHEKMKPYLQKLADLTKPTTGERTLINHYYYDYMRWHFLGTLCLKTGDYELGKMACMKAAATNQNVMDQINLQLITNCQNGLKSSA